MAILALLLWPAVLAHGAEPEGPYLADPLTGVAMEGYDPVSYFTEAEPRKGSSDFEFVWAGRPWYFASEANRDVFIRAPDIYAPRFGGHCATGLARGHLSDGDPRLYLVHGQRLYLFYSIGNREAFLLGLPGMLMAAETRWPEQRQALVAH